MYLLVNLGTVYKNGEIIATPHIFYFGKSLTVVECRDFSNLRSLRGVRNNIVKVYLVLEEDKRSAEEESLGFLRRGGLWIHIDRVVKKLSKNEILQYLV